MSNFLHRSVEQRTQADRVQDYPYAPSFTQAGLLGAVKASTLFTDAEKTAIFSGNAKNLFGDKIKCTFLLFMLFLFSLLKPHRLFKKYLSLA